MDPKSHWEHVYQTKAPTDVSWYQPEPRLSLELIQRVVPEPGTPIIDVGAGASTLVDGLLDAGYTNLTVLDVAEPALAIVQSRLGERAVGVRWLEANVLTAELPEHHYGLWHDRAVFHFLTDEKDRAQYVSQVQRAVRPGGHVIVASFAPDGPERCSGLTVVRYSPDAMHAQFGSGFTPLDSVSEEHRTPGGAVQSFVYCLCRVEE
jgi:ubiquinone/menaquinone biosynthesis C-methylase UbiE